MVGNKHSKVPNEIGLDFLFGIYLFFEIVSDFDIRYSNLGINLSFQERWRQQFAQAVT
jgi:hypothetical protein